MFPVVGLPIFICLYNYTTTIVKNRTYGTILMPIIIVIIGSDQNKSSSSHCLFFFMLLKYYLCNDATTKIISVYYHYVIADNYLEWLYFDLFRHFLALVVIASVILSHFG